MTERGRVTAATAMEAAMKASDGDEGDGEKRARARVTAARATAMRARDGDEGDGNGDNVGDGDSNKGGG